MKLLLCVASLNHIEHFLKRFSVQPSPHPILKFISSVKVLHHDVDILETGEGIFQTNYKVTKALSLQKYHLALKISLGSSYNETLAIGTVLNVVNEKPGDYGTSVAGEWKDIYDLELLTREEEPHQRGGFVNLNNSYMNVFMPFKKVVGVTVNHWADIDSYAFKKEKYRADCETRDGLGFVYPCLFEKQNYYHLSVVERNLATKEHNEVVANEALQNVLSEIVSKI